MDTGSFPTTSTRQGYNAKRRDHAAALDLPFPPHLGSQVAGGEKKKVEDDRVDEKPRPGADIRLQVAVDAVCLCRVIDDGDGDGVGLGVREDGGCVREWVCEWMCVYGSGRGGVDSDCVCVCVCVFVCVCV